MLESIVVKQSIVVHILNSGPESLPRAQKSCRIRSRQIEYRAGTIPIPQLRGSLMVAINARSAKWT